MYNQMLKLYMRDDTVDELRNAFQCQPITPHFIQCCNTFMHEACGYMLVHDDVHFVNQPYTPIVMIMYEDDVDSGCHVVVSACELLYNTATNVIEIYSMCVGKEYRRKNYCTKMLQHIFDIQNILRCKLWIAVSNDNPMYTTVVNIYQNAGFVDDVKLNSTTPSGIQYDYGFLEMCKFFSTTPP